jgi:hypothetical protein
MVGWLTDPRNDVRIRKNARIACEIDRLDSARQEALNF